MTELSRRTLLGTGAGLSAVALGGPLLAGCGGGESSSGGAKAGEAAATPAYQAATGPKPDIVGDANIPDTFFHYPADPVQTVTAKPGDGKPISILTQTYSPVTPQPPTNTAWAHLNEQLGSDLEIQQIPQAEYINKFSTTLAGGQLPDMFFIAEVADMPAMVEATCLDLSDHLAGDAIKKYPNLAAIPSEAWEVGRFNGRLYGLPTPRGAMSSGVLFRRDDLLASKGINPEWKNFQEFYELATEVNDPRGGRWATTVVPKQYIKNMLGLPNFWRHEDGTMKSWWTDEKMEQALEAERKWAKAGLMNPDAFARPNQKNWFTTGKAYFNPDSFTAWAQYMTDAPSGFDIDVCDIPAFDGQGKGHLWMSFPSFGRSAINKKAGDRVETLLKVADYLAAPFGSKEYLAVKYGKQGADYTLKGTDPVPTPAGGGNTALGVKYIVDSRIANYLPGHDEAAKKLDAAIRRLVPDAYRNDAVYLFSKEYEKNFQTANTSFEALENDIVQGRKPVSAWRPAADAWWKDHGQKMAEELAQAYQDAGRS
ncbi:extracellular solute-binding protein [Luteococcus peritonei]|uniref:Extracellular solute-binding protein n=1 Tax=Luteococcus peritonei TaxID=88874 RepID=A0ABW4RUN8_9ACTN